MPGLRPLALGEILEVGIKLYTRHWRVLMACVVWVVLPLQIVSVLVTLSVAPEQLDVARSRGTVISPGEETGFLLTQGAIGLVQGLVAMLGTAACFKAVSDAYRGVDPEARRSLKFALGRMPALVVLTIITLAALVVAALALLLPAIWLGIAWSLAIPVLLFERASPLGAMRRSFGLVKGRWWPVAGTIVVGVVLVAFVGGLIGALLVALPTAAADGDAVLAVATVVGNTVASVVTTPFTATIVALVYFDQRVRKEGLRSLGEDHGADVVSPVPGNGPEPALLPPEVTPEQRARAPFWPPPPGWKPDDDPGQGESFGGWAPPRPPQRPPPG
jgi:hypothetical protein